MANESLGMDSKLTFVELSECSPNLDHMETYLSAKDLKNTSISQIKISKSFGKPRGTQTEILFGGPTANGVDNRFE